MYYCRTFTYHDKALVLEGCADACIEQLLDFCRKKNLLPQPHNVELLMSAMDQALCLPQMIEFAAELLSNLPKVEQSLKQKGSSWSNNYVFNIALSVVGYLRGYQGYMIYKSDDMITIFERYFNYHIFFLSGIILDHFFEKNFA